MLSTHRGYLCKAGRLWMVKEATVLNLPMCNLNEYFLFKSVIRDFSSGYLSVYSSLSAFSIPVRDRNSCTFFSNCLFSLTENLPNLIATPRIWGRRKRYTTVNDERKRTTAWSLAITTAPVSSSLPIGEQPPRVPLTFALLQSSA